MRQGFTAPLQAQMQQNQQQQQFHQCFTPVNNAAQAAKVLRNEWDDTLIYSYHIGVLMLNDYLHPLGCTFAIPYNGEMVSVRKLFSRVAAMNTAHVYIAINSPLQEFSKGLGINGPNARLMQEVADTLSHMDISIMGFLIIDPLDHVFLEDDGELTRFGE